MTSPINNSEPNERRMADLIQPIYRGAYTSTTWVGEISDAPEHSAETGTLGPETLERARELLQTETTRLEPFGGVFGAGGHVEYASSPYQYVIEVLRKERETSNYPDYVDHIIALVSRL